MTEGLQKLVENLQAEITSEVKLAQVGLPRRTICLLFHLHPGGPGQKSV